MRFQPYPPSLLAALLLTSACALEDLADSTAEPEADSEAPEVILPAPEAAPDAPDAGVTGGPPPGSTTRAIQYPGRGAIFGFNAGAGLGYDTPHFRGWVNHGGLQELAELTGPVDRQLVGDFLGNGHDQVLFLNYWSRAGLRRAVIADFYDVGLATNAPALTVVPHGDVSTPALDGVDDFDDLAIAGDFTRSGHDQVMFLNRDGIERLRLVDFVSGKPVSIAIPNWVYVPDHYAGGEDDFLAGDFLQLGYDQLLFINGSRLPFEPHVWLVDLVTGRQHEFWPGSLPSGRLDTWSDPADRRYVGDFRGVKHAQLLMVNRKRGDGRVRIVDFSCLANPASPPDCGPTIVYTENLADSYLLNGWTDDDDLAFVGDFTNLGRDQMMFINQAGTQGRTLIVDYGLAVPVRGRYLESWGVSSVMNGWQDADDVLFAGRFTPTTTTSLMAFNNGVVGARIDEVVLDCRPGLELDCRQELVDLLCSHFTGRIVIPQGATLNLTGIKGLPVRSGVHLIGQRGHLGRRPTILTGHRSEPYWFLNVVGNDVRIEGLHFFGPANNDFDYLDCENDLDCEVSGIGIIQDPDRRLGRNIVIVDNELDQWPYAAIVVQANLTRDPGRPADSRATRPEYVDQGRARVGFADRYQPQILRNYIHHNATNGAGYGIVGSYALIEGNVFDYNRHAVSYGGGPYGGYTARRNYCLESTLHGDYQHFDSHGTGDVNGDGYVQDFQSGGSTVAESSGYGGVAGERIEISYNTIRGEQSYSVVKTRPAFMLRGKMTEVAAFHSNIVVHDNADAAVLLKDAKDLNIFENPADFNFSDAPGNAYNTDYSMEIAVGDFDGDRYSDVFVANGTAWFYSAAGSEEWRFLQATYLRTPELAFADLNRDGKTDVIWRDVYGWIVYSSAGTGAPTIWGPPQSTAFTSIKQLRFHDFNGDGHMDAFFTNGGKWYVKYAQNGGWSQINAAAEPIDRLYFGQIDGIGGTDVMSIQNGRLHYSSGAAGYWTQVPNTPITSHTSFVVGDFDDDNRYDDLVWQSGNQWRMSSGGRGAITVIKTDGESYLDYESTARVVWGDFDLNGRMDALRFDASYVWKQTTGKIAYWYTQQIDGLRFVAWMGLGSGNAMPVRSRHNMR